MDPQTFLFLFALLLAIVYLLLRLKRGKPRQVQRVIRQQRNPTPLSPVAGPAAAVVQDIPVEEPVEIKPQVSVLPASGWKPLERNDVEAETFWRLEHAIREMQDIGRDQMVRIDFNMEPKELATVLASNPFYAARILKTVNSASIGLRTRIDSLPRAITFLGYNQVKNIVFQHMVNKSFSEQQARLNGRFDLFKFWIHSHAVSICSDYLLRNVVKQPQLIGVVTTAALLHDIGWVVFDRFDSSLADRLYERLGSGPASGDSMAIEEELFGFNHLVAGRMLAEQWEIPQSVCEMVGLHHCGVYGLEAGVGREQALGACVIAKSEQLCAALGFANPLAEPCATAVDMAPVLGAQAAALDSAPVRLREDVEKMIKFIQEFNRG